MQLLNRIATLAFAPTASLIWINSFSHHALAKSGPIENSQFPTHLTKNIGRFDGLFISDTPSSIIEFKPPVLADLDRPRSGNRNGGASRGCTISDEQSTLANQLIAIVPVTEASSSKPALSLTTKAYPSFWFYIPYALDDDIALEFVLESEEGNKVYQTKFISNADRPGIIEFSLPDISSPLNVDSSYQWYLSVYCNSSTSTISTHVHGWITRVNINSDLEARLEDVSILEMASVYADNGIWQETLTTLGTLYREEPQNATAQLNWKTLLENIELQDIAEVPLLECCEPIQLLD